MKPGKIKHINLTVPIPPLEPLRRAHTQDRSLAGGSLISVWVVICAPQWCVTNRASNGVVCGCAQKSSYAACWQRT
jgi:hypothetical protein